MCLHAGECFLLNVEVFGVDVELIFKNWFRLSMRRPSSLSIHALSLESKSVARFDTLH